MYWSLFVTGSVGSLGTRNVYSRFLLPFRETHRPPPKKRSPPELCRQQQQRQPAPSVRTAARPRRPSARESLLFLHSSRRSSSSSSCWAVYALALGRSNLSKLFNRRTGCKTTEKTIPQDETRTRLAASRVGT